MNVAAPRKLSPSELAIESSGFVPLKAHVAKLNGGTQLSAAKAAPKYNL